MHRKILIFELLVFISAIFGENMFEITAYDAFMKSGGIRARSMGGVFVAIDQGLESLLGNPAGLTTIKSKHILFSASDRVYSKEPYWDDPAYISESQKYLSIVQIGFGGALFLKKSPRPICIGVTYRAYYDWSRAANLREPSFFQREQKISGYIRGFSISMGKQISERLRSGFSLHFPHPSDYVYNCDCEYQTIDNEIYEYQVYYQLRLKPKPFFQIGAIYELSPKFDLGLNYISPHQFTVEKNGTYQIPGTLDVGLAWKCTRLLLLAMDIIYRPWERYLITDFPINDVKSGYAFRTGLEYGKRIQLRSGFAMDCMPLLDRDGNPVYLKIVTLGLGCNGNHVRFNIGSEFKFFHYNLYDKSSFKMRDFIILTGIELF
ncbi:hypothetical protein JW964_22780 [candidate division KSB1 bacterium]|nr:hypothetical protein [candidate division KSB1 bacterium]